MNTLRSLSAVFLCLALAVTALAQESSAKKEKPNHEPLFAAIDTNKDGCMTEEEWRAAGAPMSSFNGLVKDGCVTREIMLAAEAPDGIDLNGDGFFTIEEFREFDKIMSAKMAEQGGGGSPPGGAAENRPTISAGERALTMLEVQNTFSKHAYYHQVGKHCEEMDDIWVKEDGAYAKTATWRTQGSIYEGIPLLREYYCTYKLENQKKTLEEISKKVPSIKNIPENIGVGDEYVMHTQETPVIEVAGDGKTAKGIWYSIGLAVRGSVDSNGNTTVTTGWMWEKYAVDFVKEDGKWKIWHLVNVMDQGPIESGGQGQGAGGPPPGGGAPPGGQAGGRAPSMPEQQSGVQQRFVETGERMDSTMPQPTRADPNPPQSWSPMGVPKIDPPFPEPYYTFSETFSY